MNTVLIELKNNKAYKLLADMEELDLIRVLKRNSTIASLRGKIQTPMTNEEIDKQLDEIRS